MEFQVDPRFGIRVSDSKFRAAAPVSQVCGPRSLRVWVRLQKGGWGDPPLSRKIDQDTPTCVINSRGSVATSRTSRIIPPRFANGRAQAPHQINPVDPLVQTSLKDPQKLLNPVRFWVLGLIGYRSYGS